MSQLPILIIGGTGKTGARVDALPFVPEEIIDLMEELFSVVLDGRNSRVAAGVAQALGRPARDFSDYARKAAATGVWRA